VSRNLTTLSFVTLYLPIRQTLSWFYNQNYTSRVIKLFCAEGFDRIFACCFHVLKQQHSNDWFPVQQIFFFPRMDYQHLKVFLSAKLKLDEFFIEWAGSEIPKNIILNSSEVFQHERPVASQLPRSPIRRSPNGRTQADRRRNNLDIVQDVCISSADTVSLSDQDIDSNSISSSRQPRSTFDSIPIFYTPGQSQHYHRLKSSGSEKLVEIESYFNLYPDGIPVTKFVHVTKQICGVPSYFNLPFCKRIRALSGSADLEASGEGICRDIRLKGLYIIYLSFRFAWSRTHHTPCL